MDGPYSVWYRDSVHADSPLRLAEIRDHGDKGSLVVAREVADTVTDWGIEFQRKFLLDCPLSFHLQAQS